MTHSNLILQIGGLLVKGRPYTKRMQAIAMEKKWVQFLGPLYGEEKDRFLCSGTYALHAERDEAFGISITEYLKAGCIPIVPDEGGPVEIVDSPDLIYHTNDDAAAILTKLYQDESFRSRMQAHCKERAVYFSQKTYLRNQHDLLTQILNGTP